MSGEEEETRHAWVPSEDALDVSPSASSDIMLPTKRPVTSTALEGTVPKGNIMP